LGRAYWALDGNVFDETEGVEIGAGHLKVEKGDYVLWFKRHPELTFYGHGIVEEAKRTAVEGVDGRVLLRITLAGAGTVAFDEPRLLSDFGFSLECLYRPSKPAVHFRRRYRYLPRDDFEAVVAGKVDLAATLVGIFLLEMPSSTKSAFAALLIEKGHQLTEEVSLAKLWQMMDQYSEAELLAGRELLSSIRHTSEGLDVSGLSFDKIRLDHGDETASRLRRKADELDAFAAAYEAIRGSTRDRLIETDSTPRKEILGWLTQMTRS